ncbi:MAG: glycosyltransferase [Chloroflexi bacterium]|nr:glycosyltransferase [Chloroflexota bacterium]
MQTLSIVIPVYYNQDSLAELRQLLGVFAEEHNDLACEFVFVDDGSGDGSFEVLKNIAAEDVRVKVVKLSRNFGSNAAILAGMTYATGAAVAFIAADLQDSIDALSSMVQAWQTDERVVFAVRRNRDDPFMSRLFATVFNTLLHWLVLKDVPPTGVGFFLVDRSVVDIVLQCEEKNAHLIYLIVWLGFKPHVVVYDRAARKHGHSRWTFTKKFKYAVDTFVAFSYMPIRLASFTGIIFSILGLLAIVYVIIARLFLNVPVEGWASLMIVVLISSGVQMLIMGVLGEYLWRNLDQTRKRPIFIVDKILNRAGSDDRS